MKELLYLKDDQLKDLIEKLFIGYRETFSDSKKILNKYSLGVAHQKVIHLLSMYEGISISELLKKLKVTKHHTHTHEYVRVRIYRYEYCSKVTVQVPVLSTEYSASTSRYQLSTPVRVPVRTGTQYRKYVQYSNCSSCVPEYLFSLQYFLY